MTKLIMHGCNGHMGQVIARLAKEEEDVRIVAGVDVTSSLQQDFPVYPSIAACQEEADVVIDFSTAKAVDSLLTDCVEKNLPLVLCTTGLTQDQIGHMEEAAKAIPILKSANMSLGINTLLALLQDAARVLAPAGFDMEILEAHHHRKLDAPSGTALALADSINESLGNQYHYVYDRSQVRQSRDPKEIGISALRAGSIVGEHTILFAGEDEVVEFKHTAYSRAIFAKGALEAAKYLKGRPAGRYDMSDVIRKA